jgi:hypothetical protein
MLLTLLAVLSSTSMLVGAVLAAKLGHAQLGGYLLAIIIGLSLAACNLWLVRKVGFLLARLEPSRSESLENWFGKAFCLTLLLWAACAEFVGFWVASVVMRFAT